MKRQILATFAATLVAIGALILTSDNTRADHCAVALEHATPELRASYLPLCIDGYAIEGVPGMAYPS